MLYNFRGSTDTLELINKPTVYKELLGTISVTLTEVLRLLSFCDKRRGSQLSVITLYMVWVLPFL